MFACQGMCCGIEGSACLHARVSKIAVFFFFPFPAVHLDMLLAHPLLLTIVFIPIIIYCSESFIAAIKARAGLPAELVKEVNDTRAALLSLRQNVVLLRDPDDPSRFYPVRDVLFLI
jgi:hypothetical protein